MSWYRRIGNVFRAEKISADLDDELSYHIAETTDELVAGGMTEEEARREASRRFGNYTVQKENTRDMLIARTLEAFVGDLRYGARQLRLNPGFAAVAILSLALGIGANSAIFQLINAVCLRGLPVSHPEQLVAFERKEQSFNSGWLAGRNTVFTFAQYEQLSAHQEAFSGILAFGSRRFNLSEGGEVRWAQGLLVTPNFLDLLGGTPIVGRWAPAADPLDCSGAGALLDYAFWQREFGGDPNVVGSGISIDGRRIPVQAVAPASFYGLEAARRFDVALPVCLDGAGGGRLSSRTVWWLTLVGRLKPGWSVERASAHVEAISGTIFRGSLPDDYGLDSRKLYLANKLMLTDAHAGVSTIRRQYENPLWVLLGVTGLVLLIACANLANLLLAKASARLREVALRRAVGASPGRLVGQFMSESLLLAGCGAVLGGFLAYLLSRSLVLFLSSGNQQLYIPLGADWRVLGFTSTIALGTCLLFGLAPALRAARTRPAEAMHGGRCASPASERHRLRRALVVSQVAMSFVLLVGALLFGQSLRNLTTIDIGMESDGVLIANVDSRLRNPVPAQRTVIFGQLEERIRALPDVVSASGVQMGGPFSGVGWNESVYDADPANVTITWLNRVTPGYFETMKTPLVAGRDFGPHDNRSAPAVAIVNQKLVDEVFGSGNPLGRTIRFRARPGEADPTFQIVGVVKNTKYNGLREQTQPLMFLSVAQQEDPAAELSYVIRARGSFTAVMASVRRQMAEVDPSLLVEFRVLDAQVADTVMRERLMANLTGGFGLLAAILSALGLYGVMSYMVARRRNEIGVRMALGAETGRILGLVFGETGWLLVIGLAVGLAGSFALSRYAESLLFGLQPNDALTLILACSLLAVITIAAALFPARRAARVDPAVVLRDE